MDFIWIEYNFKKYKIPYKKNHSLHYLFNQFIEESEIFINIENYQIVYQNKILLFNKSLEYYEIDEKEPLLCIYPNQKGGGFEVLTFFFKNPVLAIISLLISLLPLIILPFGIIPLMSSLLGVILKKGSRTLFQYLVCDLGKFTIVKRFQLIITIIQYILFFIMVYVTITFPIIILCLTMKGGQLSDNPSKICSPMKTGSTVGMILSIIYFVIYFIHRIGALILVPLIQICKKTYYTNFLFVPLLKSILSIYNSSKFIPSYIMYSLIGLPAYFTFLDVSVYAYQIFLMTMEKIGCDFNLSEFKMKFSSMMTLNVCKKQKEIMEKCKKEENMERELMEQFNKMNEDIKENEKIRFNTLERKPDEICIGMNENKCCHPSNLKIIADGFMYFFENSFTSRGIKSFGFYPFYAIMTQGFYESALEYYTELNDIFEGKDIQKQKKYLNIKYIEKGKKWTDEIEKLYSRFKLNPSSDLFEYIMKKLGIVNNKDEIDIIKEKINKVDDIMVEFAIKDKSAYEKGGNRLFKTIFKIITVDSFCNFSQTSKNIGSIIYELEDVKGVTDLLKIGTICGLNLTILYFIAFIALVIGGLFNYY